MPVKRQFLGWQRPGLVAAAEWLIERHREGNRLRLDGALVVVPGSRAGRRLLEILVERAEREGWEFLPPEITTVGRLPELLYPRKRPFAEDLLQQLAWAEALRNTDPALLAGVIAQLPEPDDTLRWLELARVLQTQHRELASEVWNFQDVVEQGQQLEGFTDTERWQILAQVQDRYLRILDQLDYWDRQTARRVALQQRECHTDRPIYLVATVDMNEAIRRMLDQVAEHVTALVIAPESLSGRFDEHGCLVSEAWEAAELCVEDDQVELVEGPADQALAVARTLADLDGRYAPDELTIGVPDERLVPYLEHQLERSGLACRWGAGRPVSNTAPARLLACVAVYLETRRYRALAALARHPDVYKWLERKLAAQDRGSGTDWITQLDRFYNTHLPSRLTDSCPDVSECSRVARGIQEAVSNLLAPLMQRPRGLHQWAEPIRQFLAAVYADCELDREQPAERLTLAACQTIAEALRELAAIPVPLSPLVSASDALAILADRLRGSRVIEQDTADAVEMLGWLELPLDDAPVLVVTSLNEGLVPKSINSDLFLPNSLRCRLQLEDNSRRYARDAYALSVLLHSREKLRVIVGRRDHENNPLAPSRLLLACDRETMARRVLRYFDPPPPPRRAIATTPEPKSRSRFRIPRPRPLPQPIDQLSVTQFKTYLACKYRFYLSHVLKLEAVDDLADELDGAAFGQLMHEVLHGFGKSEFSNSTDPDQIREVLREELRHCFQKYYGEHWLPAVGVQIEQLRMRLDAFARRQAEWAAQGWRIEHVEVPGPAAPAAELIVDGEPILLRGRIDRIDVHEDTGQRVVLDYKSADSGHRPEKTHLQRGQWIDLQLPLYRHLLRPLGLTGPVKLGYVLLPKDSTRVEFCLAPWGEPELAEADRVAEEVVRGVRRQQFWPPTVPAPDYYESFAPICLDGILGAELFDEETPRTVQV